jgi:hypothetical protein
MALGLENQSLRSNKTLIFSTHFRKILKYQISRNSLHWEARGEGRGTDGPDEANSCFFAIFRPRLKFYILPA